MSIFTNMIFEDLIIKSVSPTSYSNQQSITQTSTNFKARLAVVSRVGPGISSLRWREPLISVDDGNFGLFRCGIRKLTIGF